MITTQKDIIKSHWLHPFHVECWAQWATNVSRFKCWALSALILVWRKSKKKIKPFSFLPWTKWLINDETVVVETEIFSTKMGSCGHSLLWMCCQSGDGGWWKSCERMWEDGRCASDQNEFERTDGEMKGNLWKWGKGSIFQERSKNDHFSVIYVVSTHQGRTRGPLVDRLESWSVFIYYKNVKKYLSIDC